LVGKSGVAYLAGLSAPGFRAPSVHTYDANC